MVTLYRVTDLGSKYGLSMVIVTVPALDMKYIAEDYNRSGWHVGPKTSYFEKYKNGNMQLVAEHTGRGWRRIPSHVKGWDRYLPAARVREIKNLENEIFGSKKR